MYCRGFICRYGAKNCDVVSLLAIGYVLFGNKAHPKDGTVLFYYACVIHNLFGPTKMLLFVTVYTALCSCHILNTLVCCNLQVVQTQRTLI